ncbi:unnamed protein product [Caenorhabditis angaria]|uniref:Uncharacterized protein n=1 Tax=Caenorhabditis angaria TaxID=860376 RepID=A0A9P1I9L6_9PELO|nr:unnamed protein product [Caenorhabditis angaria]
MLRRIKKLFGFSSRGAYFPNNEVSPADGSVLSTSSRKMTKKQQKKLAAEQEKEAEKSLQKQDIEVVHSSFQQSNELVIGGEETVGSSQKTDSVSCGEQSEKFPSARSSDAAPSLKAEATSNASLAGSTVLPISKKTSSDSEYSTDTTQEDEDENIELCNEMAVDVPNSVEKSVLRVNVPEPCFEEDPKSTPIFTKADEDMEKQWRDLNEQLNDILSKPAPFQVSTSHLPPMKMLEQSQVDISIEEFEGNNSVTRILNESHEKTLSSPEQKHLRSFGY